MGGVRGGGVREGGVRRVCMRGYVLEDAVSGK